MLTSLIDASLQRWFRSPPWQIEAVRGVYSIKAQSLAVATVERKGDAHLIAIIAADLEAVRAVSQ